MVDYEHVVIIFISSLCIFTSVIAITRIAGLHIFVKMSSIDFASTITISSVIAAVIINEKQSILKGILAIAFIVLIQISSSYLQRKSSWYKNWSNPLELLNVGKISKEYMKRSGVSETDLMAKLREANAVSMDDAISVALETTVDISVLHSNSINTVSDQTMEGVERAEP